MSAATLPGPRRAAASDAASGAGVVLALVVACQLMIVLDATVVNVALPPIREDLGFSAKGLAAAACRDRCRFGGWR